MAMHEVSDEVMRQAYRNAAIIGEVLSILPVGYIPNHTPESVPKRVEEYVKEVGVYYAALERIANGTKYAKEIAQNAIGYTDNHEQQIELLREENLELKLKLEEFELKAAQAILSHALNNENTK